MSTDAKRRGPARMQEIANLVGVSVSTVSRALKGDPVVNEATRIRVAEAAERLVYRINPVARSLRTQRTQLVLAVVPDIGNPFYSYVLAGIEDEAQRNGYSVLIGNVAGNEGRLQAYCDQVRSGRADGIILLTGHLPTDSWLDSFDKPAPVVALCEPIAGVPFVGIDDRQAAADMTSHLAGLGCQRIGHIRGPQTSVVAREREAGYRQALAAAGLTLEVSMTETGDTTIDSGHCAATSLLSRHPELDAIFAANDEMAIGAVNALRHCGIDVPGDVRVSGCDGLEFGAKYFPPLSTVEQPRTDLGATAVRVLLQLLSGLKPAEQTILPHTLTRRATTGG